MRALHEYFVGGIKTNISLFRRILRDPDFRAGKLDTGFLDRLLAKPYHETDGQYPLMAAIGAAIFAASEPKATLPRSSGGSSFGERQRAAPPPASNWRRTARAEALRSGEERYMTYDVVVDGKTHQVGTDARREDLAVQD